MHEISKFSSLKYLLKAHVREIYNGKGKTRISRLKKFFLFFYYRRIGRIIRREHFCQSGY